jgi:hypothetical protein
VSSLSLTSGIDDITRRRLFGSSGCSGSFDGDTQDEADYLSSDAHQQDSAAEADDRYPRPSSIAQRLSQLFESRDSWKSKVEEKDIDQFTVEGKMTRLGLCNS